MSFPAEFEIKEAEFIFEKGRIYIRKAVSGYLMFFLGSFVSSAMLSLNCDILLPSLRDNEVPKGLGRLFKKR